MRTAFLYLKAAFRQAAAENPGLAECSSTVTVHNSSLCRSLRQLYKPNRDNEDEGFLCLVQRSGPKMSTLMDWIGNKAGNTISWFR